MSQPHETARAVIESTPSAVAVTYSVVLGKTWSDWAAIAGFCFIVLQSLYLLWRWRRDIRRERRAQELEALDE